MWSYNYYGLDSSDSLSHYGVLGMKWGIRRYRNYDGSYTQKGVKRYDKAKEKYDKAKENAIKVKKSYKTGNGTRLDYKNAKLDVKKAKKELDEAYGKLKLDKRADEGKKLYQQGKTITSNTQVNSTLQGLIFAGSYAASKIISDRGDTQLGMLSGAAIAAGGTAVNAILAMKTESDNRKLRAYYSH